MFRKLIRIHPLIALLLLAPVSSNGASASSISTVIVPTFDSDLHGAPYASEDYEQLHEYLQLSVDETYLEPGVFNSGEERAAITEARQVQTQDSWDKILELESGIEKLRHMVFGESASKLRAYEIMHLCGNLAESGDIDALALISDIFENSATIAKTLAESKRRERIEERVFSHLRERLLAGDYDLAQIRSLERSEDRTAVLNETYSGLPQELIEIDLEWYEKTVRGIENDIVLSILRAAQRTQNPKLLQLQSAAALERPDSDLVGRTARQYQTMGYLP